MTTETRCHRDERERAPSIGLVSRRAVEDTGWPVGRYVEDQTGRVWGLGPRPFVGP